MGPEFWTTVGSIAALLWTGWHSRKSNKQTKATGNGFAKHVLDGIERIEKKADKTNELLVEHLADHAGSDLTRK